MSRIHLSQPEFPDDLVNQLTDFVKNPDLSSSSSLIQKFEQKVAKIACVPYAVGLSSGTAAIHLALQVLGVHSGDYVACQSFTFCATANPIAYVGATPVFIDSELDTWNMCPHTLREYLKEANLKNKLPKAIIYVHTYGMPAKVSDLLAVAKKYEIPVIEDAAEAIGATFNGRLAGQFGDVSIFSFNGNKIGTTSGGGALVSRNKQYITKAFHLATQARLNNQFEHSEIGYNYRIGAINGLIGSVQLEHLNLSIKKRRTRFENYYENLKDIISISWQKENESNYSNRWMTTILINSSYSPQKFIEIFDKKNIELRRLWKPLHLQLSFKGCQFKGVGNCVDLWNKGLCLPSGKLPNEHALNKIIHLLKTTIERE